MLIKTEVEITPRRIADLMISAIEGGSNYWCESVKTRLRFTSHTATATIGEAWSLPSATMLILEWLSILNITGCR